MNGRRIVSPRFPYVPVTLRIRGWSVSLDALLDTGFDGDVVVPRDFIRDAPPPDGSSTWRVADGSEVDAPSYWGTLRIGVAELERVVVTVLGNETMIGCGIIRHFNVTLSYGERVIVEP
jgi:predicted aspartyl protease